MARIPTSDIDQVKAESDLVALARSRGIEIRKHGSRDFIGKCPFHDDNDSPNFIISPGKGLYHCMACGAAGNAIQFVEKFDGVSFRHAFELLANGGKAVFENGPKNGRPRKKASVPGLACPLDPAADDGILLDQVSEYYHERLQQSKAALAYLASRGLDDEGLVKRFRIGYADRTLGLRLPDKRRKDGQAIRERLEQLGVFRRESGHEHFNGSLVFPIVNGTGQVCEPGRLAGGETHDPKGSPAGQAWPGGGHVCEIYGRKITKGLRKGTPMHLYLPGPHHGIFNPDALKSRDLILCESILDALTFISHGMENATCIYGTQGFTDELFTAIKSANLDAVRFAYDADDSGELAAKRDAQKLQTIGVECFRIRFPLGEDANSYTLAAGGEALKKAVRSAQWLGAKSSDTCAIAFSSLAAELVAKDDGDLHEVKKNTQVAEPEGLAAEALAKEEEATKIKKVGESLPPLVDLVRKGDQHELQLGERIYRVGGLMKNGGLESLKVTLRLRCGDRFHLDQVDLCKDVDRRRFCERAAHECRLEQDLIKRDLGKLLLACEGAQDERLHAESEPNEAAVVVIPPEERAEAQALLLAPDLIAQLMAKFDSAGIVGEEGNKLAAYLAASSRLLDRPLAIIIQSTSAAGKSALMEAVLSFFPTEEQIKYSAMTSQSLYYLGEKNLKHKILAIVEEEDADGGIPR